MAACPTQTLAAPPPCGLWALPALLCCEASAAPGPCAPVTLPTCPEPTPTELIEAATALLNAALGGRYPGWCCQTDELCRPTTEQCGCPADCSTVSVKCCTYDRLPVGSARWPIHSITGVSYDSPTGADINPALYRLTSGNFLQHLGDGWPSCRKIYVHYFAGGIPLGGETACLKLACVLRSLWDTQSSGCEIDVSAPLDTLLFDASSASGEARNSVFQIDPFVDQWVSTMIARFPPTAVGAVWWPTLGGSRWTRTHISGGLS